MGITKVSYSGEQQWLGRLCRLSITVRTYGEMLEERDCKRIGDNRSGLQPFICATQTKNTIFLVGKMGSGNISVPTRSTRQEARLSPAVIGVSPLEKRNS